MTDTDQHLTDRSIALIGPTGGMGTFVLHELVSRGLPLRAVVRHPGRVAQTAGVTPVVADVYDTAALSTAVEGVDTVVSAFNPGWDDPDLYANYLRGARGIEAACTAGAVARLIIVGGAGSLFDSNGRQLLDSFLPPEPYASGVKAARDYLAELRDDATVDWVYFSPALNCGPLGPSGRTGHYRLGTDQPVRDAEGESSLSREDLAVVVADEVAGRAHHRERFTAAY